MAGGQTFVDIGDGRFTGLGLKTGRGGRFADLGFKIGGAFGEARWRSWRKCGIIVKLFVF